MADIMFNEVFPLWCVAPVDAGGLGLESSTLGWLLSASGASLLSFQLLIFPAIARRVAITRLCQLGVAATVVLYVLLPFVPLLGEQFYPSPQPSPQP